jgi:hypothetical protein
MQSTLRKEKVNQDRSFIVDNERKSFWCSIKIITFF